MLRRLLEASARASAAMPASSSPVGGRVTSSPDLLPLPTAPPDNLTGPTLVSSDPSSTSEAAGHHTAADPASTPGLLALNSSSNSIYSPDSNTSDELEYSEYCFYFFYSGLI